MFNSVKLSMVKKTYYEKSLNGFRINKKKLYHRHNFEEIMEFSD